MSKLRGLTFWAAIVMALVALSVPAYAIVGNDDDDDPPPPSLAQAQADMNDGDWGDAIAKLKLIVAADSDNAEAYNLLGYAYRKSGNLDLAQRYYQRALRIDPKHTGALEYQGELYLMLDDVDKAKANLAKIEDICGTSCAAYKALDKAIG